VALDGHPYAPSGPQEARRRGVAMIYQELTLAPHLSAETLQFHYGKHHKTYVDNLNNLVKGTDYENAPLENWQREILTTLTGARPSRMKRSRAVGAAA